MRRHSAIALIILVMLALMAYLRQWQIPWIYYITATVLYSCTVIAVLLWVEGLNERVMDEPVRYDSVDSFSAFRKMKKKQEHLVHLIPFILRGANFALVIVILLEWALSTTPSLTHAPTLKAILLCKLILGIVIGFGVSAVFEIIPRLRNGEIAHGWLGVAVFIYALIVPLTKLWTLPWLYYTFIMTIFCGPSILSVLVPEEQTTDKQTTSPASFRDKGVIRGLWGAYLVMLLWVSILLFDLSNFSWAHFVGVLILAIPVCFALSFLISILIAEQPAPTVAGRKQDVR